MNKIPAFFDYDLDPTFSQVESWSGVILWKEKSHIFGYSLYKLNGLTVQLCSKCGKVTDLNLQNLVIIKWIWQIQPYPHLMFSDRC
jgi:hypothetical protein